MPHCTLSHDNRPPVRTFRCNDPERTRDFVGKVLAPHRMDIRQPKDLDARLTCFDFADGELVDIQYGAAVTVYPQELESCFLVHAETGQLSSAWLDGREFEMRRDSLHVSSPGRSLRFSLAPNSRILTMRLTKRAFEDHLANAMQLTVCRPLAFYPERQGDAVLPQLWRNIVGHAVQQMEAFPEMMGNPRIQRHYASVMIEALLNNYANNYSDQIALCGNDISPWYVRRARDIIHDELDDTLSITALSARVGVSARSLQNGFRRFLGVTPVEYLRRHRLEMLHRVLIAAEPEESVTSLMLECGISNFGRYAQFYKRQFGCLPSLTLRSGRKGALS